MLKVLRLNHGTVIIFKFDLKWNWIYSVFVCGSHTPRRHPSEQVEGFVCWFVGVLCCLFSYREVVDIVMGSVLVGFGMCGGCFFEL